MTLPNKKDKLVMPKGAPKKHTKKTPDGTDGMKLSHQEVNFGNVQQLTLRMISNMNANSLEAVRLLQEIKELLKRNEFI